MDTILSTAPESLERAYAECERLAREHYENFPVASLLVPREARRHVAAVYAFARIADDYADEERYAGQDRIALLEDWHRRLLACADGADDHPVFVALGNTIRQRRLPLHPFEHLLTAFRMDVVKTSWESFEDLLGYCRYSANPVGQLVLMLFGHFDPRLHMMSDDICTALQLTNFWQDVVLDHAKGRCYLPQEELRRHGVDLGSVVAGGATPAFRELMAFQVQRTREIFRRGKDLPGLLRGRLGIEIDLTLRGGMRILDRIEEARFDVIAARPKLAAADWVRIAAGSLTRSGRAGRPEGDREVVRDIARRSRSSFYYAFFFLPREQREAIQSLYAFCREVDDAVDATDDAGEARAAIGRWRREIAACFGEGSPSHPVARELAGYVARFALSREPLEEIIRGVEMDLAGTRYETWEDLQIYCRRVASAVGLSCIEIFGSRGEPSRSYATTLGLAFQLTNILRDLRSDAQLGRCYLPAEEMRRFGYTAVEAAAGKGGPGFRDLMAFQCARAEELFAGAASSLPASEEDRLVAAEVMRAIYHGLLQRIASRPESVLEGRVSLSTGRKIARAATAWAKTRWSS